MMMRIWLLLLTLTAWAQTTSGPFNISGTVVDPTGALVPAAVVSLHTLGSSQARQVQSDASGTFRFPGVSTERYEIEIQQAGFAPVRLPIAVTDRSPAPVRILLQLTGVRQEVTVNETAEQISTAASENTGAVTLDRSMLDSLPVFDQNYIGAMRQFLDPGSVSTGGVTLIVNGMEQKNVGVSSSAIQQVKINQNPYSAEYSRPGRGAIEIVTKPTSQAFHGAFNFLFRDQHLNARDAFASVRPPEQRRIYEGSLVGVSFSDDPGEGRKPSV